MKLASLILGLTLLPSLAALRSPQQAHGSYTTQKPHITLTAVLRPHRTRAPPQPKHPGLLIGNVTSPVAHGKARQQQHPQQQQQQQQQQHQQQQPHVTNRNQLLPDNEPKNQEPPSASARDAEERELLCLFRLYVDSFVSIGNVDMNDRLVFLVPLIIIYWHHRHPHTRLPLREIDGLLRDIGQEAQVHRLVLQELARRVGPENQCTPASRRQHSEQSRAIEAMRILKDWMDEEERLEQLTARQSGAREIRHWFRDLFGGSRRDAVTHTPVTTIRPSIASNLVAPSRSSMTTTAPPEDPGATEYFGLPHMENRTRTDVFTRRPGSGDSTVGVRADSRSGSSGLGLNMTLLSELGNLQSLTSNTGTGTNTTSLSWANAEQHYSPTHYTEFFDLVTSIIDEINHLNNVTGSMMMTPPTEPSTLV